jgi:galactose mutarotase-like enzyme
MTIRETCNGYEVRTIVSSDGGTRASFVPEKGGMGSSLVIGGREMLFQHDFFWERQAEKIPGGWPFLFPICGRLERGGQVGQYLCDGRLRQMLSHGFGPRIPWKVVETDREDTMILQLTDTESTRQMYPFRFEVLLTYRAEKDALACEQIYSNRGNVPMPYYAGFHPYFRIPGPGAGKEKVLLDYKPVRAFKYNERLTDLAGETAVPRLPAAVTDPAINERITRVGEDRETKLVLPDGLTIHMAAEGVEDPDLFPYIQLYTMADKPFFCVEPWMGFPNALNTVAGARWLKPGQSERGILRVWITQ